MISENSKIGDPHRLILNLTDKMNLKRSDRYVALSKLSIYHIWRTIKKLHKNNEYGIQSGMINMNYLKWINFCEVKFLRVLDFQHFARI